MIAGHAHGHPWVDYITGTTIPVDGGLVRSVL